MPPLTATPAPGPTTARATDRVLPTTVARRERAGSAFAPPARRRIFRLPPARLRVILMRDGDVPPTVDAGVADAGRTGSDVIE